MALPWDRVASVSLQSTHSPNSENTRTKGEGAHACRVGKDGEDAGNPQLGSISRRNLMEQVGCGPL